MNKIILIGNANADVEGHAFDSGSVMYKFRLGVSRYNRKTKENVTDWFNVETFSKLGEYIKKGNKIAVEGEMINQEYEKEGEKKYIWKVFANNIEILTPKKKDDANNDELIGEEEVPF